MTPPHRDTAHWASNGIALLLTIALSTLLFAARSQSIHDTTVAPAPNPQAAIEVALQQDTAAIPVTPPTQPLPQTQPAPSMEKVHRSVQRQTAVAESLAPAPADVLPTPADNTVTPDDGALLASTRTATSAPPTPASRDAHIDLENQYAAGLRADIDRRTRPPDSPQYRLRRPSGEVRVGFVVVRNGEPKAVHVLRSSGSSILDEAAVAIVSGGHYPPMSANAFVGEAEHTFAVTIEFRRAS